MLVCILQLDQYFQMKMVMGSDAIWRTDSFDSVTGAYLRSQSKEFVEGELYEYGFYLDLDQYYKMLE